MNRKDWKLLDSLSMALAKLSEVDAYSAKSIIAFHRERDYLTPKQQEFARILIVKAGIVPRQNPKKEGGRRYKGAYLYAISDGCFVKLGQSGNPQTRIRDMQTGHPIKLELIWSLKVKNAKHQETKLHRACKKFRVRGEWFKPDCMELVRAFAVKD